MLAAAYCTYPRKGTLIPPKPALSIADQVALLTKRGLTVSVQDRKLLETILTDNGYSRIARYWRYDQVNSSSGSKSFTAGATVLSLVEAYRYDSALRHLMSQGLEVFEVTLRSRLGYFMSMGGAAYTYRDLTTYRPRGGQNSSQNTACADLIADIERDLSRAREDFIMGPLYRGDTPPLWDAMEVLSLGSVSKMYSLLADQTIRYQIAKSFGYPAARFAESVFRSMTVVRNVCAHHARVWNRTNIQVPPPVLNRLKTEPDKTIYQGTPWAWIVVIVDMVDTIQNNDNYSTAMWDLINTKPAYVDGLKHPKIAS